MPFGSGLSAPLAGCRSRTLTTGVHLRSAIHPLLGRLRIGAPRLWPLSPKLHTSDCSFACPGSSTWVDKVPSRDTPSLNLADRRGGVDPGNPQVARNQSRIGGLVTPAVVRVSRRPAHPSVNPVNIVALVRPTLSSVRPISATTSVSDLAKAANTCRPPASVSALPTLTSKCRSPSSQLRMNVESMLTEIAAAGFADAIAG